MWQSSRIAVIVVSLGLSLPLFGEPQFHRDPFVPLQQTILESASDPSKTTIISSNNVMKLTGIIWDSDSPSAIFLLNGKQVIVSKNDAIKNWKIKSIYPDKVSLKSKSKTLIVRVGKEIAL